MRFTEWRVVHRRLRTGRVGVRRTGAVALVVLLVGALIVVGGIANPAPASAAPALPPGFVFHDSPSGQGPYDLTDFDYLPDGSVLSTGKTGLVSWVSTAGQARTIATIPVTTVQD